MLVHPAKPPKITDESAFTLPKGYMEHAAREIAGIEAREEA